MLKRKHIIYGVLGLILTNPAYAALVCSSQPACSALGYDTTDVECPDGVLMSCPLDKTYKKCIKPDVTHTEEDCAMLGFTATDKSDWCPENKVLCPYDDSYSLCASGLTCSTLGFSRTDKTAWCQDIVKCPYDATMTLCASKITCLENQVLVDGKCYNAYASCEAAGYDTDDNSDMYCSSSDTIYLSDGTLTSCYDGCSDIYSSCSAAGFVDPLYYDYCAGSNVDIYTSNSGDTYTCNTYCGDCLYTTQSDCESANTWGTCSEVDGCYEVTGCANNYFSSGIDTSIFTKNNVGTYGNGLTCMEVTGCVSGYTENSSSCSEGVESTHEKGGVTCYKCQSACSSGYARTVSACGSSGSGGWSLGSTADSNGCYECIAKECPSDYATSADVCKSEGYCSSCSLGSIDQNNKYYSGNSSCYPCIEGCAYTTQSACESARANVECGLENGCYVAMRCKTGYVAVKR